ncbi:MAG: restriction endonuclease subunit S [Myxococcales bacterium]|nr:restriction endonuclease subunit S [Myxococcales bacterium]
MLDQRDYFDREIATAGKVHDYYVVDQGDYVYNPRTSAIAPVGPVSRNNLGKGVMSPLYTVFRFNSPQTDFYEHYFRSTAWHPYLRSASSTGARHDRMAITPTVFMRMPVPEPSPAEQQKIADCLTSLDAVIAAQGRKVEALKAHKKGLMQVLFPQEGQPLPRLRFPEFRGGKEWEQTTLAAIGTMNAGEFVAASNIAETPSPGCFPCYGGNGLRGYTDTFTHDGRFALIGRQGALCGNAFLIDGKFHATEHALVVTPATNIDVSWLYYALGFLNLNRFSIGQAQPGLSVTVLQSVAIALPTDKAEQQRIADCLASLDAAIAAASAALTTRAGLAVAARRGRPRRRGELAERGAHGRDRTVVAPGAGAATASGVAVCSDCTCRAAAERGLARRRVVRADRASRPTGAVAIGARVLGARAADRIRGGPALRRVGRRRLWQLGLAVRRVRGEHGRRLEAHVGGVGDPHAEARLPRRSARLGRDLDAVDDDALRGAHDAKRERRFCGAPAHAGAGALPLAPRASEATVN